MKKQKDVYNEAKGGNLKKEPWDSSTEKAKTFKIDVEMKAKK